jgi:hypothetical protein
MKKMANPSEEINDGVPLSPNVTVDYNPEELNKHPVELNDGVPLAPGLVKIAFDSKAFADEMCRPGFEICEGGLIIILGGVEGETLTLKYPIRPRVWYSMTEEKRKEVCEWLLSKGVTLEEIYADLVKVNIEKGSYV